MYTIVSVLLVSEKYRYYWYWVPFLVSVTALFRRNLTADLYAELSIMPKYENSLQLLLNTVPSVAPTWFELKTRIEMMTSSHVSILGLGSNQFVATGS